MKEGWYWSKTFLQIKKNALGATTNPEVLKFFFTHTILKDIWEKAAIPKYLLKKRPKAYIEIFLLLNICLPKSLSISHRVSAFCSMCTITFILLIFPKGDCENLLYVPLNKEKYLKIFSMNICCQIKILKQFYLNSKKAYTPSPTSHRRSIRKDFIVHVSDAFQPENKIF